ENRNLFGGSDFRVRIENLFEQCGSRPRMAAKQSKAAGRQEFTAGFVPSSKNIRIHGVAKFLHLPADFSRSFEMRGGVGNEQCLGALKGGHGVVVTALTIEDGAKLVTGLYAGIAVRA